MLSVRLYGNGPVEVIGQTRLVPQGEADGQPLQEFVGDTSDFQMCPGDNVLVRSYVNAVALSADSPPVTFGTAAMFAALAIKLRVRSCPCAGSGPNNQTLIDVGRQIVVPGNAGIEVLAPYTFQTTRPEDIESISEYFVQVVVCPIRCCYPPLPQLTFWRAVLEDAEPDELTWVVPRGARRMQVGELPAGIVAVDFYHQNRVISTQAILSGDIIEIFGAPDRMVLGPVTTAPGNILVKWEIEG